MVRWRCFPTFSIKKCVSKMLLNEEKDDDDSKKKKTGDTQKFKMS
jgi:hypothetical protein